MKLTDLYENEFKHPLANFVDNRRGDKPISKYNHNHPDNRERKRIGPAGNRDSLGIQDLMVPVANFVRTKGYANFNDLKRFVQRSFDISDYDLEKPSATANPRWIQKIYNCMASGFQLQQEFEDIVRTVPQGLATIEYARKHGIEIEGEGPSRKGVPST